jgi:ABC-type nitrate/sulfonate/bicarbonate transport system permease component
MTCQLLLAFALGTVLGLSISVILTRRMRRELEQLVTILR